MIEQARVRNLAGLFDDLFNDLRPWLQSRKASASAVTTQGAGIHDRRVSTVCNPKGIVGAQLSILARERGLTIWRKCDLHRHTAPDDGEGTDWNAEGFVEWCLEDSLDVVAVTDHNDVSRVAEVIDTAQGTALSVIPGIEVSTDKGHVVILAPDPGHFSELQDFITRIGAVANSSQSLTEVIGAWRNDVGATSGRPFRDTLVTIGAHSDSPGSMLGPSQTGTPDAQVAVAAQLDAIEVTTLTTRDEWLTSTGVKQTGVRTNVVQSSDAHFPQAHSGRATWLYLEELDAQSIRQALATPESAVMFSAPDSTTPTWIKSVEISDGNFDGLKLTFSPRCNAIIGPPSSGKSFILDCLRFAFASTCGVEAVRAHSHARLSAQLGEGAVVTVVVSANGADHEIVRAWGGADTAPSPFTPAIFSQNELQARAMDKVLSMDLLDLHCPESGALRGELEQLELNITQEIEALSGPCQEAQDLSSQLENAVDGLSATIGALEALTGTEDAAKIANDIGRVQAWRTAAVESVEAWRAGLTLPGQPNFPSLPVRDGSVDLSAAIPRGKLKDAAERLVSDVESARDRMRDRTIEAIRESAEALDTIIRENPWTAPADGIDDPEKQAARIRTLRTRQTALLGVQDQLKTLEADIESHVNRAITFVRRASEAVAELRAARKKAATEVNKSMGTFAARILPEADTSEVGDLFRSLAQGSGFRNDRISEVWSGIDRERLIRSIANHLRHARGGGDEEGDLSAIVAVAVQRGRLPELAKACVLRPADQLDLMELSTSPPRSFGDQTEGMHALAIKEISFASSGLPAISDQPEDAVPTQKVFEQMVPALRQQRANRQFILVSHDANIVVAADVERVFVLNPMSPTTPTVGTLFDEEIRLAALDLLEGGEVAFERRSQHYARR